MAILLTIGQFSRMTHLSVKALRHYHDTGVLVPAEVDPFTGYRSYDAAQVPAAQVIRRLRDLGMPLDSVRTVVGTADVETRNQEIAAHLERMEEQLEQTQASVAGLRALLTGPAFKPDVTLESIPEVTALAIEETVAVPDMGEWAAGVFRDLGEALAAGEYRAAGCFGALFPGDFFEVERAELTVFIPVEPPAGVPAGAPVRASGLGAGGGRVRLSVIPAVEAAVAVHEGPTGDLDRTYGAIGAALADGTGLSGAIGLDAPIREYFEVGFTDTDDETRHRTRVCWPVFRTTPA